MAISASVPFSHLSHILNLCFCLFQIAFGTAPKTKLTPENFHSVASAPVLRGTSQLPAQFQTHNTERFGPQEPETSSKVAFFLLFGFSSEISERASDISRTRLFPNSVSYWWFETTGWAGAVSIKSAALHGNYPSCKKKKRSKRKLTG